MSLSLTQVQAELAKLETEHPPSREETGLALRNLSKQEKDASGGNIRWGDIQVSDEDIKLYIVLRRLKGGQKARVTPKMMEHFKKQDFVRTSRRAELWAVPMGNLTAERIKQIKEREAKAFVEKTEATLVSRDVDFDTHYLVDKCIPLEMLGARVEIVEVMRGTQVTETTKHSAQASGSNLNTLPSPEDAYQAPVALLPAPARRPLEERPSNVSRASEEEKTESEVAKDYIKGTIAAFAAGLVTSEDANDGSTAQHQFKRFVVHVVDMSSLFYL